MKAKELQPFIDANPDADLFVGIQYTCGNLRVNAASAVLDDLKQLGNTIVLIHNSDQTRQEEAEMEAFLMDGED
jgi:hypothetical protein